MLACPARAGRGRATSPPADKVPPTVLAVWLFVGFWVLVAFALFFIAARGGLGGARAALQSQRPGARKAATVWFLVAFVGFGIAMPIGFLVGNHANASSQIGGMKLTAAEKRGRELFG